MVDATRSARPRVAVFVEHKFIPEEIAAYRTEFPRLGFDVDFVSRIWYPGSQPASVTFYGDVDPSDGDPLARPDAFEVRLDLSQVDVGRYAAVVMAANYTSVRLRWPGENPEAVREPFDAREFVRRSPVATFFAAAMRNRRLVKGALCHGLWILAPYPELLAGRRVTCHAVVMADVLNAGADVRVLPRGAPQVVTDDDLVTGYSKHEVVPFVEAIAHAVAARTPPSAQPERNP
jgi:protease I